MIIDHVELVVSDYAASKAFYSSSLAPLNIGLVMEVHGCAGFGKNGKPEFWFRADQPAHQPLHIAFVAETRNEVDQFFRAAIDAGGRDNGAPGLREIYHPDYYGAFVLDPDGHNIEAVCHQPQPV